MTVYVDDLRQPRKVLDRMWKMSHMIADTRDELDAMAEAIELEYRWKQHAGERREHYDVTENYAQRAVSLGAKRISTRELAKRLIDRDLTEYLEGRK